jgi:hypothetical protein
MVSKFNKYDGTSEYRGLKDDTKPVANNGDKFHEIDTGKDFMFNESTGEWKEQPKRGGGGGGGGVTFDKWFSSDDPTVVAVLGDVNPSRSYAFAGAFVDVIRWNKTGNDAINNTTYVFSHSYERVFIAPYWSGSWASSSGYCLRDSPNLQIIDVRWQNFGANMCQNCPELDTVILRRDSIVTLSNGNCFSSTPFASGGAGGALYVPQALIADYQAATNWSAILSYENNRILPIEGSIYETQYADGTPITT